MSTVDATHDNGLGEMTTNDEDSPVQQGIEGFENLSDDQKTLLASYLANSGGSEEEQLELLDLLSQFSDSAQGSLMLFLEKNPGADLAIVKDIGNSLIDAGPDALAALDIVGESVFSIAYQLEDSQYSGAAADFAQVLAERYAKDPESISEFIDHSNDLVTVMTGGVVSPPERQNMMYAYANAPAPFDALSKDMDSLTQLNQSFSGAGSWTMDDLHNWDLSAAGNDNGEGDVNAVVNAMQDLPGTGAFSTTEDVRAFVDEYVAAGGSDIALVLQSLPEVEAGIIEIKEQLGLEADEGLSSEYEGYLLELLANGLVQGDMQSAIDGELRKISTAYEEDVPLGEAASMAYQTTGFTQPESAHPLPLYANQGEEPREPSVPTEHSKEATRNSGSIYDGFEFPPLTAEPLGYDDLTESPLYVEDELQDKFGGDVQKYATYLAQAHKLLEELGLPPGAYDGQGEDELDMAEVKLYVFSRGYEPEDIVGELRYVEALKAQFDFEGGENGVAATQGAHVDMFDVVAYIKSDGDVYDMENLVDENGEQIHRPRGQHIDLNIFPPEVFNGFDGSRNVHKSSVTTSISQLDFVEKELAAHDEMTGILSKYQTDSDPAAEVSGEFSSDIDELKKLQEKRVRYGNMDGFIEQTKTAVAEDGSSEYYNSDGSMKMAYDEQGQPIHTKEGTKQLTMLEVDALKKYGNEDILDEMLSPEAQEKLGFPDALEKPGAEYTFMKGEYTDTYGRSLFDDVDFNQVNHISDLRYSAFTAEAKGIADHKEVRSNDLTEANSKLERYLDFYQKMMDFWTEQVDKDGSNFFNVIGKF